MSFNVDFLNRRAITMKPTDTLTTGEVAKYCGVNFRTVIRWIERGHLKSYKLPGRGDNRIQASDFVEFLKENQMPIPSDFQGLSRKVLVVDDEAPMARAISRVLSRGGFEVEIANSGFEAGAMLATNEPALITLDLSMPGLDGFQMLDYIRSNHPASLKILVISALSKEKLQQAIEAGANAALQKPYDNKELLATVESLLEP